jgi:DNA polymerase III delta prime subunit
MAEVREKRSVITCERVIATATKNANSTPNSIRMDAVIHYVTTIPAIRNLLCVSQHDYLPNQYEPVEIDLDIYFELKELKHTDGQVDTVKFQIFSYEHEVQYLQAFIDRCNGDYERRIANKLGTSLYYFDMVTQTKSKKSIQNTLPNTHILYTKHKFHTTRSFDNVFFEQRDKVKNHVSFFLTRKDWYEKKGIPYTLGFMFHGEPGCGKTSTIKAIANTAHRHIFNIHLSEIKSKAQLSHLFFNEEVHVFNSNTTERFTIPIHERLYVIEDIDAMGDAVLKREWKKPVEEKPKVKTGDPWLDNKETEDDSKETIDLSFLLNLLDGTLEVSGRILAISSNFPERIDRALIRPGRIDMIIHFKKCNRQILQEMITSFYDTNLDDWTTEDLDYKWSPAEVNQILFRNFTNHTEAIQELKTLNPKDLYGFESRSQ